MSNISTVEITVTALSSRVAALKKALTDEQLKVYEKTMLELKEKFIKNNPEMTNEQLQQVEVLFK